MGYKTTYTVKRTTAIQMLREKQIKVYDNDCIERLYDLMNEFGEELENYQVVPDDTLDDYSDRWKEYW